MTFNQTIKQFLQSKTAKDLPKPKNNSVVSVHIDESTDSALKKLTASSILAAPVVDDNGAVVGLLSIKDLTGSILKHVLHYDNEENKTHFHPHTGHLHDMREQAMVKASFDAEMHHLSAHKVRDLKHAERVGIMGENATLYDITKCLAGGVHRVAIVDENKKLINIVPQTTILNIIVEHMDSLGELGEKKVSELHLGQREVISINDHTSTVDAFHLMLKHNISAVAVTNETGMLVSNISFSDMKGLGKVFSAAALHQSVHDFVAHQIQFYQLEARNPTISCSAETHFKTLILKLSAPKIHRIYITDHDLKPRGVISLTDVMAVLTRD